MTDQQINRIENAVEKILKNQQQAITKEHLDRIFADTGCWLTITRNEADGTINYGFPFKDEQKNKEKGVFIPSTIPMNTSSLIENIIHFGLRALYDKCENNELETEQKTSSILMEKLTSLGYVFKQHPVGCRLHTSVKSVDDIVLLEDFLKEPGMSENPHLKGLKPGSFVFQTESQPNT